MRLTLVGNRLARCHRLPTVPRGVGPVTSRWCSLGYINDQTMALDWHWTGYWRYGLVPLLWRHKHTYLSISILSILGSSRHHSPRLIWSSRYYRYLILHVLHLQGSRNLTNTMKPDLWLPMWLISWRLLTTWCFSNINRFFGQINREA